MAATHRDDRVEPLIEAGITIAAGLDLEAVLSRLIDLARELTGARYAAVGVLDSTGTRIARFHHGARRRPRPRSALDGLFRPTTRPCATSSACR